MARRIRIHEPVKERTFNEALECRARRIVRKLRHNPWEPTPLHSLRREIAATLDHIDGLRATHREQRRRLLRQECYADNELHDSLMSLDRYSPYRFHVRERVQRRLIRIDRERRKLSLLEADDLRGLHDHLLTLVNRHTLGR